MSPERTAVAIAELSNHKSLGTELTSDQSPLTDENIAHMALCSMQRAHEILTGKSYYDYDTQEWVKEIQPCTQQ